MNIPARLQNANGPPVVAELNLCIRILGMHLSSSSPSPLVMPGRYGLIPHLASSPCLPDQISVILSGELGYGKIFSGMW